MNPLKLKDSVIIAQTEAWIRSVVIGCNFCPFAAKAMLRKSIRYVVLPVATVEIALESLIREMENLDRDADTETTFIILPHQFDRFRKYLDLVRKADTAVKKQDYDGIYQVASFHPEYYFEGSHPDDPANYTNRSIYPMLQILREESVSRAVDSYDGAENIPEHNITFARQKGLAYMQLLRAACMD